MIDIHSGLPISMDPVTGELSFRDGLLCAGHSEKALGKMTGLFKNPDNINPDELAYYAYRDIRFKEDEALFQKYGYRYDITVILPGPVNGEYKKTSGHYHGYIEGGTLPYPEVYEVVEGEIVFIFQKNTRFDAGDGGRIEDLRAVHVKAGQSIIVPPFCGHGSINPTNGVSAFSNIAVVACPLSYEPIASRRGLAAYIMEGQCQGRDFLPVPNPNYGELPEIRIADPVENPDLGIEFGKPCYRNFIEHPERYDFLLHPERYMAEMEAMTKVI